jgi:hypothetical protein
MNYEHQQTPIDLPGRAPSDYNPDPGQELFTRPVYKQIKLKWLLTAIITSSCVLGMNYLFLV